MQPSPELPTAAGDVTRSSTSWSSEGTPTRSGVCTTARGSITSITSRCISSSGKRRAATAGPVSPRVAVERLMLLDAVLVVGDVEWLTSAAEKAAYLQD